MTALIPEQKQVSQYVRNTDEDNYNTRGTCLMICTDNEFIIQIGDRVIHNYSELYYENKELLEKHLREAQILSVTPWLLPNRVVDPTDVHLADYFLDYCTIAADSLARGEGIEIGSKSKLLVQL